MELLLNRVEPRFEVTKLERDGVQKFRFFLPLLLSLIGAFMATHVSSLL